uniref:Uncharacterized protein n=1 Tax=Macaca fascicularis TaxID=9541 RepID=A0A7N9CC12_MACFA
HLALASLQIFLMANKAHLQKISFSRVNIFFILFLNKSCFLVITSINIYLSSFL